MERDDRPDRHVADDTEKQQPRLRFIVAKGEEALCECLTAQFAGRTDVEVIMDRRRATPRQRPGAVDRGQRAGERRSRSKIDDDLASVGFAVVPIE
jgi:hypothetical protein